MGVVRDLSRPQACALWMAYAEERRRTDERL
jgi:hypothetical protein